MKKNVTEAPTGSFQRVLTKLSKQGDALLPRVYSNSHKGRRAYTFIEHALLNTTDVNQSDVIDDVMYLTLKLVNIRRRQ